MGGDPHSYAIIPPPPPPLPPPLAPCDASQELDHLDRSPSFSTPTKSKKRLCKQLSMLEAPRYKAWERRRRRILDRERRKDTAAAGDSNLTDDDLKELKGCIELGFGFNEESGQRLCPTIPALDLYLAVNRQLWTSPVNSPSARSAGGSSSSSSNSPMSDSESGGKIFNPGDDPQQVKTRLRHWAQAVACSVLQSPLRGGEIDYTDKER